MHPLMGLMGEVTQTVVAFPSDIAGLVAHYDAGSISGVADGGAVTTWEDSQGSFDVTQADADKKPTWQRYGINGRESVRFDGGDLLVLTAADALSTATSGTILVVVKPSGVGANRAIAATGDEASIVRFMQFRITEAAAANIGISQANNDTTDSVRGSTTVVANSVIVASYVSSGTAYSLYVNGATETVAIAGGGNNGDWFGDIANRDNFTIGALKRTSEQNFFLGDIAELLVYDAALSDADRARVERYLGRKYLIGVA